MPSPDLVAAIRHADATHDLFSQDEAVLVAVSGGPDSVALLAALRAYAPERDLRLTVGHLDHMLRPESVDDAAWVAQLAAGWGIPAILDARDVRRLAVESGRGIEDAARTARYAFLAAAALRSNATTVAVAHQADDQAETVLMNFVRGTGLAGLRGMTPAARYPLTAAQVAALEDVRGPRSETWPPRLVRPLLDVPRAEIEAWLAERGIQARVDATNADPAFLRNRLRTSLIPAIEALNPAFKDALTRSAAATAGDLDFVERAVDAAWSDLVGAAWSSPAETRPSHIRIDRAIWDTLHPALQRRLLRRAAERLSDSIRDLGWQQVEDARRTIASGHGAQSLPGGLRLSVEPTGFSLGPARPAIPPLRLSTEPMPIVVPGKTHLPGGWVIVAEQRPARPSDLAPPRDPWQAWTDADAVGPRPAVRARLPGDSLQPLGLGGRHKSLQDLFVDHHIPQAQRDGWPVVVAGDRVVWVPGLRLDERARVRPETRRLLVLRVETPEGVGR